MTANDKTGPLPSPAEFARLLAEYATTWAHALETHSDDDFKRGEALRMRLIESYERVYAGAGSVTIGW